MTTYKSIYSSILVFILYVFSVIAFIISICEAHNITSLVFSNQSTNIINFLDLNNYQILTNFNIHTLLEIKSYVFLPEIIIFFSILIFITYSCIFFNKEFDSNYNSNIQISVNFLRVVYFILAILYIFLILHYLVPVFDFKYALLFNDLVIVTKTLTFYKIFICFLLANHVYGYFKSFNTYNLGFYEYIYFLLFILIGSIFSLSSNDFLSLFCGLEIMNLSLYVLAAFVRKSTSGLEASTKYLILGSVSTGIFLKGIALFYFCFGNTNFLNLDFMEISFLYNIPNDAFILIYAAIILVTISFLFKLGIAPFHAWIVDVYGGSALPITALFATVVKATVFIVFVSLSYRLSWPTIIGWETFMLSLGLLSATLGALGAFRQHDLKRFLAYSSVNHAGFLIMFLAFYDEVSLAYSLFYLVTYLVSMVFLFQIFLGLTSRKRTVSYKNKKKYIIERTHLQNLSDLQNLSRIRKRYAMCISLFMFSLGGIPPFLGFFPKLALLKILLDSQSFFVLFCVILVSLLSLSYYLRIIKIMYFDKPTLNIFDYVCTNSINNFDRVRFLDKEDNNILYDSKIVLFIYLIAPLYISKLEQIFIEHSVSIMNPFM